jgi:hypothetical protein
MIFPEIYDANDKLLDTIVYCIIWDYITTYEDKRCLKDSDDLESTLNLEI